MRNGGGDGDRTHDPFHAMEVLSQLSYAPNPKQLLVILRVGNFSEKPQKNKIIQNKTFKWWAKQDLNL